MSTNNLLMLVNGAYDNISFAIYSAYGSTYVDSIFPDKGNLIRPFSDGEFESVDSALNAVLTFRNEATAPQELVIKCFKHFSDGRVDIGRAWVITEEDGNYIVSTEIDGFSDKIKTHDVLPLQDINTAVEFVGLLERVYSQHNSCVGEKTAAYGVMCQRALDILTSPFDADALKLTVARNKERVER